jgi:hypothetical protein
VAGGEAAVAVAPAVALAAVGVHLSEGAAAEVGLAGRGEAPSSI